MHPLTDSQIETRPGVTVRHALLEQEREIRKAKWKAKMGWDLETVVRCGLGGDEKPPPANARRTRAGGISIRKETFSMSVPFWSIT